MSQMSQVNIENQTEDNSINLKELLFKYLIHWKWFVLSIFVFLVGAKLYLRYSIPEYKSFTTLLIKREDSGPMSEFSALEELSMFSGSKKDIDDEMEVLKSRALIEKTIKEGEFNISYILEGRIKSSDAYGLNPIKIDFKQKTEKFYEKDTTLIVKELDINQFELFDASDKSVGKFKYGQEISSNILGKYTIYRNSNKNLQYKLIINLQSLKNATNKYKGKLNVASITKFTNVLEISFTDPIPKKSEDFLNKLVEIYNNDAIFDKNIISEKTAAFINERLLKITTELGDVEKEVQNYKSKNNITDLPTEAELYLKNASESNREAIVAGTELKVVDMMIDYIKNDNGNNVIPSNLVPNDNSAAMLIAEFNNSIIQKNRLLKNASPENPTIIGLNDRINSLKFGITESLNKLKSSLRIKTRDIDSQNNRVEGRISQIPRQEREFRGIFRQQQIKEELYLYLFKKREETAITLAATAPISKVVDKAYSQDVPVSPKRSMIYLVSLILGTIIPFVIIYILQILDTKVKNRHDLSTHVSIPFIGDVPHSDSNNEIIQSTSRTSSAEAIRIVRTNLEFVLSNIDTEHAKTIFLTSTLPKEGKTFIAVNLAATIAISGKKVLLIGLDIRNPKLDEYVKLPNRGVTNYLSSKEGNIKDYIVKHKDYEHFDILPAGVIPPNPAELLMSSKVEKMFEQLKSEYEYIIVDTAPVSLVTDTLLISKNADAFVYVVRANYLEKSMLRTPQTLYQEKKLPNMCVLLNDTITTDGYGYGYGYVEAIKKPWYKKIFSFSFFG